MCNLKAKVILVVIYFLLQASTVQATDKKYEIETHKITDQVFVLSVAWSKTSFINSAIVVGDEGVDLLLGELSVCVSIVCADPCVPTPLQELSIGAAGVS